MRTISSTITTTDSTFSSCDHDVIRMRRDDDIPKIGYSLEELNEKRQEPMWRVMRYLAIVLFWLIWAGLMAGAVIIIVLNNHDVASTTTAQPTTTRPVKLT